MTVRDPPVRQHGRQYRIPIETECIAEMAHLIQISQFGCEEAIRDKFKSEGIGEKEAKSHAAAIYIAKGKGGDRSSRAKSLHDTLGRKLKFPKLKKK